jgi:hypothetical protein
MATTEIEKLERRYAENPQGLTFAPLAEVHRKNGDVGRALDLLRAGLELHPNYIPASIVLGRCHWDAGDLAAAEAAFAHVLRLDDENVIALKSLADINERLERFGDAQRWLNRLLLVDRSNEEARQQLARVESAKQESDRRPTPPPSAVADVRPAPAATPGVPEASSSRDLPPEITALVPEPPVPPAPPAPAPLDLTSAIAEPAPLSPQAPAEELPTAAEAKVPALEFLDTTEPSSRDNGPPIPAEEPAPMAGLISAEFVPPKESSYRLHPELTRDFVSEPEPLEVETAEELELQSSGAAEFRVPNAAEDFMESVRETAKVPAPEPERESAPPPPRQPPAPAVASTLSEPEPEQSRKSSYAVQDTGGQSVASFFAALLAARPPGASSPPSISPAAGKPPAEPAQEALTVSSSDPSSAGGVSFDEFFGAAAGGSSAGSPGNADPGKDDLDQFQSWLQNLKR